MFMGRVYMYDVNELFPHSVRGRELVSATATVQFTTSTKRRALLPELTPDKLVLERGREQTSRRFHGHVTRHNKLNCAPSSALSGLGTHRTCSTATAIARAMFSATSPLASCSRRLPLCKSIFTDIN